MPPPFLSTSAPAIATTNAHSTIHPFYYGSKPPLLDPTHQYDLWQLRQTGSVSDYHLQFETVSRRVLCMSTEAHLECFISGLREDIRRELILLRPYCVSQAFGLAQQIEAQRLASKPSDTISFPSVHTAMEPLSEFDLHLNELRRQLELEIPKIVAAAFASVYEKHGSHSQSLDSALDSDSTLDSHSTSDSSVGSDSDAVAVEVLLRDTELHCSPLPPPLVSGTTSPPTVATSPDLLHFQLSQHMLFGNPSPPLTSGFSIASKMLSMLPYDSPSDKHPVVDALSFYIDWLYYCDPYPQ